MAGDIRGVRWLLLSLALQNLGRRKARSLLLITSVAIGSAVVFTGATLMQSIDRSMSVGFTRMGADMMVVPEGALTNITAALLVVEPTELVLDADALAKANLASVGRYAAQKIVRVEHSGIGSHHDSVDLIGFDPARDFTIQPWLAERINRGLQAGDVILGADRDAYIADPDKARVPVSRLISKEYAAERRKLRREFVTVTTPYGPVEVKLGRLNGQVVQAAGETKWPDATVPARGYRAGRGAACAARPR